MPTDAEVPGAIVERVRAACAHLPQAYEEEPPSGGFRWRIRGSTLAALTSWEREAGPLTTVTFHVGEEGHHLIAMGHPFYPGWGDGLVAMVLTDDEQTDWDDVRQLLEESYRRLAPKKLSARLHLVADEG